MLADSKTSHIYLVYLHDNSVTSPSFLQQAENHFDYGHQSKSWK